MPEIGGGDMSWLKETVDQVVGNPKPKLVISKKAQKLMEEKQISEKDVTDVYYHGKEVDNNKQMITRLYNGYQYGLWYFKDSKTGDAVVTSVWKHILKRR